jgi:hypothetical protein
MILPYLRNKSDLFPIISQAQNVKRPHSLLRQLKSGSSDSHLNIFWASYTIAHALASVSVENIECSHLMPPIASSPTTGLHSWKRRLQQSPFPPDRFRDESRFFNATAKIVACIFAGLRRHPDFRGIPLFRMRGSPRVSETPILPKTSIFTDFGPKPSKTDILAQNQCFPPKTDFQGPSGLKNDPPKSIFKCKKSGGGGYLSNILMGRNLHVQKWPLKARGGGG